MFCSLLRGVAIVSQLQQFWQELALRFNTNQELKEAQTEVVIAKVDCTTEGDLCADQDVTDYPTVKFYKFGGDEMGLKFRGIKDMQSFEQFMNRNINKEAEYVYGSRVDQIPEPRMGLHLLQDETFSDATAMGRAFVVFCTPWASKCMDLEPVWKEVAKEFMFEEEFLIGSVDCTLHKTTCNENEVRSYPTILWLADGVVIDKYATTKRDFESLKAYVMKKLGKKEEAIRRLPKDYKEEEGFTEIFSIDKEEYYNTVQKEKILFIHFWTPWCSGCQAIDPIWEKLAEHYHEDDKGNKMNDVKIAQFDCSRHKDMCEELKVEVPTMLLYKNGKLVENYTGSTKYNDLVDYIDKLVEAKDEL